MRVVLKDVLIEAGDIDKYFEIAPTNLWRAKKKLSTGALFSLVEEDAILSNGQLRPADITVEDRCGVKWVSCRTRPRGISTFDAPNLFRGKSWEYYKIPKGTQLPEGLAVIKDQFNQRMGATHYTIAPAHDMTLSQFKNLLNILAATLQKDSA